MDKVIGIGLISAGFSVGFDGDTIFIWTNIDILDYFSNFGLGSIPEWLQISNTNSINIPKIGPDLPNNSFITKGLNNHHTEPFLGTIKQGIQVGAINYDPLVVLCIKLLRIYPGLIPLLLPLLMHAIVVSNINIGGLLSFLSRSVNNVRGNLDIYIFNLKFLFLRMLSNINRSIITFSIQEPRRNSNIHTLYRILWDIREDLAINRIIFERFTRALDNPGTSTYYPTELFIPDFSTLGPLFDTLYLFNGQRSNQLHNLSILISSYTYFNNTYNDLLANYDSLANHHTQRGDEMVTSLWYCIAGLEDDIDYFLNQIESLLEN